MISTCPRCQTRMKIPVEKMVHETAKIRCPGCRVCLIVRKPAPAEASVPSSQKKNDAEITSCAPQPTKDRGKPFPDTGTKGRKSGAELREKELDKENDRDSLMKIHNRQHTRYAFKKKILVNQSILIDGIDICVGGLFVHTGRSFKVGSEVSVALPLTGGDLTVRATVQHDTPGVGMGLEFVGMTTGQKQRLHTFFKTEMTAADAAVLQQKKRILLIGGTETHRRIAKSKLTLEDFIVFEASTTSEALQKLVDPLPDIVVIDWQDQAIDCTAVLGMMKKDAHCESIIKVVLTAVSNQEVQEKISEAGADECLAKIDTPPVKLAERIKSIVDSRT